MTDATEAADIDTADAARCSAQAEVDADVVRRRRGGRLGATAAAAAAAAADAAERVGSGGGRNRGRRRGQVRMLLQKGRRRLIRGASVAHFPASAASAASTSAASASTAKVSREVSAGR